MRILFTLFLLILIVSCKTVEEPERVAKPIRATINHSIGDIPNMLRGTVKQNVALMGYSDTYRDTYEPMIATGYGLVVGLKGTGSSDIPPQVRAHMTADLARRGIGDSTRGWGDITPEELINSPDTAVVIVEAVIPQAASGRKPSRGGIRPDHPSLRGTTFDAHMYAEPSSATISLEGGYLLPTLLRPGQLMTGKSQTTEVAAVSGTVFINPFANPGSIGADSVKRTAGRVLNGGEVLHNLPMRLVILEPSHARASLIQNAINRVFPEEPGQDGPTARGISDEQIDIRVPPSWKNDVPTFMELMTHITVRLQNPESTAMMVKRMLLSDPSPRNADAAMWRWRSIGERALPVIRELYEHPDDLPRHAALKAGGGLKDPISVQSILNEAKSGKSLGARIEAIQLLKAMPQDPRILFGLRPLLDDSDIEIRLQAAEAMIERNDASLKLFNIADKFDLIIAPSEYEMIYVTQSGKPQIILTGNIEIEQPLTLQAWNNRLLVKEKVDEKGVLEVRYRNDFDETASLNTVPANLEIFTQFLAHESTPEHPQPGLNLSYSRTIGALHELWRQQYLNVDFKVEQDRLLALIQRLTTETAFAPRPEFSEDLLDQPEATYLEIPTPSEVGMSEIEP